MVKKLFRDGIDIVIGCALPLAALPPPPLSTQSTMQLRTAMQPPPPLGLSPRRGHYCPSMQRQPLPCAAAGSAIAGTTGWPAPLPPAPPPLALPPGTTIRHRSASLCHAPPPPHRSDLRLADEAVRRQLEADCGLVAGDGRLFVSVHEAGTTDDEVKAFAASGGIPRPPHSSHALPAHSSSPPTLLLASPSCPHELEDTPR